MNERGPNLIGKSAQECLRLLAAISKANPERVDLFMRGVSDEQLDEMYAVQSEKLAAQGANAPEANG